MIDYSEILARIVYALEALVDRDLETAEAVLEDLERDVRALTRRWVRLDDGSSVPDMDA